MKYKIFGSATKDEAPTEAAEMATFFNYLRKVYPTSYAKIAVHIRNEGKRDFRQAAKIKSEGGFVKGAPDIIIPGFPSFVCELKTNKKGSKPSKDQIIYLEKACDLGSYGVLAYGHEAAIEAFEEWRKINEQLNGQAEYSGYC